MEIKDPRLSNLLGRVGRGGYYTLEANAGGNLAGHRIFPRITGVKTSPRKF